VNRRASLGLLDKTTARRDRAVLLTADALARADQDEDAALSSALEAVKLAPDLVPAAALAGKLLSRRGDLRRAAKTVEAAWRATPHPDLASVYINLRPGDSALDRFKRAETLARLSSWDPEARLALARTAIEAQDFDKARHTLEPLLADRPTMRACLMMADLEQAEHGGTGRVREWLARASRAPRDPAWVADGFVSDRWLPTSPVTGKLDAFQWQTPPDLLAEHPVVPAIVDDVTGDLDDKREATPVSASAALEAEAAEAAVPVPGPEIPPAIVEPAPSAGEPIAPRAGESAVPAQPIAEVSGPEAARKGNGADDVAVEAAESKPVAFPVEHAPDDPGPAPTPRREEAKPGKFRLFGS
jgi:HemY protein